ncbi:HAD family phosphatase [Ancylobacter sp. 6x-1]|uniref:HAD family phosphatase n=1 Tax=Ancylobacter crimeensis TaxID=2579147 RepID=A0ABT0D811_9HYPH|nr:HAD family phosphatase [Ancylobacter crimeensis]MCK0196096.1 HAD family phosphatase [Ancylobacter crimeensis]
MTCTPPPDLEAVAWDIDGTLVDSEPLHHRALVAGSAVFGMDLSDLPDQAYRGIHINDVWDILRPRRPDAVAFDEWMHAIYDHYVANTHELVPVPGAVETVKALAGKGVRQVCVSNSSRRIVDANLEALGISAFMAFSISLDDVTNGKPDPEPYRTAVERLNLAPPAVAAVEDSNTGARSADEAGLYVVGYTPSGGGFGRVDLAVDDLAEVTALFPARAAGG